MPDAPKIVGGQDPGRTSKERTSPARILEDHREKERRRPGSWQTGERKNVAGQDPGAAVVSPSSVPGRATRRGTRRLGASVARPASSRTPSPPPRRGRGTRAA